MRLVRGLAVAWVAAIVVIAIIVVSTMVFGGRPLAIDYYRETAPDEITIGVVTGEREWTRVTSVVEDASSVTIRVASWAWPLPGTDIGIQLELVVRLEEPLAGRTVRNGEDGTVVLRTSCLPPMYAAPGCIDD